MDDDLHLYIPHPTPARPLLGLTMLLVEDSRCASEAVRLLALHSGARLRRADSLAAARRHLAGYRPMIVIVDLGLPDGSGAELIAELAQAQPRVAVLVGTSGNPGAEVAALAAGADGFLAKPVESLALFQQALIRLLPAGAAPTGLRALPDEVVAPDPEALADDLRQVAEIIRRGDGQGLDYAAQFLAAVARSAHDSVLESAARTFAAARAHGKPVPRAGRVARLVEDRLALVRAPA